MSLFCLHGSVLGLLGFGFCFLLGWFLFGDSFVCKFGGTIC